MKPCFRLKAGFFISIKEDRAMEVDYMKRFLIVGLAVGLVLIFTGLSFSEPYVDGKMPPDSLIIKSLPSIYGSKGDMSVIGKRKIVDTQWHVCIKGSTFMDGFECFALSQLDTNYWILSTTQGQTIVQK
jgi:hypothetical protein